MKMRKRPVMEVLDALQEEGRVGKIKAATDGIFAYEHRRLT